jgi:hypothetical protein
VDVLEIDFRIVDARPGRLVESQPAAKRAKPPLEHPLGFVLLRRDQPDDVLVQALGGLVHLDQRLESVFILIDIDLADPIDRVLHSRHIAFSIHAGFKARQFSNYDAARRLKLI